MTRMRAEERRRQLLAAAREVFLDSGLEGARISQIAEHAGVNQALLYRFFDSKEAMFEAAVIEPLEDALTQLLDDLDDLDGNIDAEQARVIVCRYFRTMLGIFDDVFELLTIVLFSDRAGGHEFYQTRMQPFVDSLAERIASAGDLWPQLYDPRVTVPMSLGMSWGIVMDAHLRETEIDLDEVATQLTGVLLNGLFVRA